MVYYIYMYKSSILYIHICIYTYSKLRPAVHCMIVVPRSDCLHITQRSRAVYCANSLHPHPLSSIIALPPYSEWFAVDEITE